MIYMIGGYRLQDGAPTAIRDCFQFNEYLEAKPIDKLQSGRFEIPLALVHDRFILAMGGKTTKIQGTRRCEALDTVTNHWFQIDSLPITCVSTTAVVMND